ncbi:MAG: ABC transporter substrate-binding protein [Gammaproteobacteria bacterium]|nr:ABC transporter substrate-binding protein [Gammaproteobacteria bacterium]MBU0830752.1 ABC transporter substrate-binding protein [Gammaproteobacteria bacterium]MBU0893335.1 ABC transporter substrate-binding protein [Gammaproteobacteria bacterium]MBU1352278.1 ABC transporter substrate-binding protein [Gammaproteobacteria bacterium]MBU1508151.1 ABC transporter substrate-binding protein [Gammaproteobacteria bacterium]
MNAKNIIVGRASLVLGIYLALSAAPAFAGAVLERVQTGATVKVCIWPAYYGVTYRHPRTQELNGIDIELAAELGRDLKAKVEFVESSFPTLIDDLTLDRCDVAMFAIGILPQRAEKLAFTQPYLRSDIYGITTKSNAVVKQWTDIDKPGVMVGVQAGTFMEPVMAQSLKKATLVTVKLPATRERELVAGRVDVFMTDYPYSRRLLDNADWARLIEPPQPFFVLPYGYAVKRGDESWLTTMDAFVTRIKRDGRLKDAAGRHGLDAIVVR